MSRDGTFRLGFAAVIALWALSLGGPAYAANHTVSLSGFNFSPATLTVHVGDTVTWVHDGSATPHSVTADAGSFDSSPSCPPTCMGAGSSYQHTFTQAGTFAYHCRIHGAAGGVGMAGTIVVAPVAATTTTPPTTTPPTTAAAGAGPAPTTPTTAAVGIAQAPPSRAAGSGSTRVTTAAGTAPAPTLAFTGSHTGRIATVGALLLLCGLALQLSPRARPRRGAKA